MAELKTFLDRLNEQADINAQLQEDNIYANKRAAIDLDAQVLTLQENILAKTRLIDKMKGECKLNLVSLYEEYNRLKLMERNLKFLQDLQAELFPVVSVVVDSTTAPSTTE